MSKLPSKVFGKRSKGRETPTTTPLGTDDPAPSNDRSVANKGLKAILGLKGSKKVASGSSTPVEVPDEPGAAEAVPKDKDAAEGTTNTTKPAGLTSSRTKVSSGEAIIDNETMIQFFDLASRISSTASTATRAVPGLSVTVAPCLQLLSDFLAVFKKVFENWKGWKKLLTKIDEHQKVFNDQLDRLKVADRVPDPDSPLLAPIKQYAEALESLMEAILDKSGITPEEGPKKTLGEKLKRWFRQFSFAELEKEDIESHGKRLTNAMDQFRLTLEIFVGFEVHYIKGELDSLSKDLRSVGENIGVINDLLVRQADATNTISPLGRQHSTCLDGTRLDALEEIRMWALDPNQSTDVYCIGDAAGTGKSTVARTLYDEWAEAKDVQLMAFFFSQEDQSTKTPSDFCSFMKEQIKNCGRSLLDDYWKTLDSDAVVSKKGIQLQWKEWVEQPLSTLLNHPERPKGLHCIVVIDALDECMTPTRQVLLKKLLDSCGSGLFPGARVLLTTRNEPDLVEILQREDYRNKVKCRSLRSFANAETDVATYVNSRLDENKSFKFSNQQRNLLVGRCAGLFIFASIACDLLKDAYLKEKSLDDILRNFTSLDALYHTAVSAAVGKSTSVETHIATQEELKKVLGTILVAREPLSVSAIAEFAQIPVESVRTFIGRLGSILASNGVDDPVYVLHTTFTEFLVRQSWVQRAGSKLPNEYAVSRSLANRLLAKASLATLSSQLDGVCVNDTSGTASSPALRYAASAFISHIIPGLHEPAIQDNLRQFLRKNLLHWIEHGAVAKSLPKYMQMFHQLQLAMEAALQLSTCKINEDDVAWCRDVVNFMHPNQILLHEEPTHVYSSALLFCPRKNKVYTTYISGYRLPQLVFRHASAADSPRLVLPGYQLSAERVAYSSSGSQLVIMTCKGDVNVWDSRTGALLEEYKVRQVKEWDSWNESDKHPCCLGINLLLDESIIISCWNDWKLFALNRNSALLRELPLDVQHSSSHGYVKCVTWVANWSELLLGDESGCIHRLRVGNGLESVEFAESMLGSYQKKAITSLSLSPHGNLVASTSFDSNIQLWEFTPGLVAKGRIKRYHPIYDGAFSPNGIHYAVADIYTLEVYDMSHRTIIWTHPTVPWHDIRKLNYSPSGDHITIWGVMDPCVFLLKSCGGGKHDDATASRELGKDPSGRRDTRCVAFSPDETQLFVGYVSRPPRIYNVMQPSQGEELAGYRMEAGRICSLSFSHDATKLATFDAIDGRICLWDLRSGNSLKAIETGELLRAGTSASSDCSLLVTGEFCDKIQFWSMDSQSQVGETLSFQNGMGAVGKMAVSPDERRLAFTTWTDDHRYTMIILDIANAATEFTIDLNFNPQWERLAWHPTCNYICCGTAAWELTSGGLTPVPEGQLEVALEETFPQILSLTRLSADMSSISVGCPTRQLFYTLPGIDIRAHVVQDSLIALGSTNGDIIVLDFTPTLTQEEKDCLERLRNMCRSVAPPGSRGEALRDKETWFLHLTSSSTKQLA